MSVRRWIAGAVAGLALLALSAGALAAAPAWTTYRHDGGRSGIDPDSTSPLTPTLAWQTQALDGPIWGQALVYGSRVYVATENDTVYALDSATGAIAWQRHVATAVPSAQLSCGDISPTVGITSTPVIDPSTGRIYVVADTWDGSNPASIAHEMYALSLVDGSIAVGPVAVDPAGSTHKDQLQRASLALDAGKVIIGYGGNDGDCGTYHGWLVAVPEGGGALQTFEVDRRPGDSQGAIWGSGNAPAIDASGDIWIATGNGNSSGTFDFSESVIKLDPNLNVLDYWAPTDWSSLDGSDTDLGSSMPVLLPNGLVFEIGKGGLGYLLDASSLGGVSSAPFSAGVCSGSWGGGIYANGVIYVTCSDGLHALSLNTAARTFTPVSGWSVDSNASGPPIYAGGLVWAASSGVGTDNGTLYGLDPNSGAVRFSAGLGGFEHFTTPSAGGGRLFVANQTHVTAFQIANVQIANQPGLIPTAISLSSSANPSAAARPVSVTATVAPSPDGGTITFSDGGQAIPGCAGLSMTVSGTASCTTQFARMGRYGIGASYSGDASYSGSGSTFTQIITPNVPALSRLVVRVVHRKLRLSLTLSRPAEVVVGISRLAPGRIVGHRCRAGARHGRRCTASLHRMTLRMGGRKGRNRFKPGMRSLRAGRYRVTATALDPSGGRSEARSVVIVVRGG